MTKKQPARKTRYDDEEWHRIADAVRALGRDADTTTVRADASRLAMMNDRESLTDYYRRAGCDVEGPPGVTLEFRQVMLRTALQRLVADTPRPGWPPPPSDAPELRKLQRKTEELRRMYADYSEKNPARCPSEAALRLKEISTDMAHAIEDIGPNPHRFNHYDRARNFMMADLLDIWATLGGDPTGKRAEEFMYACLKPVFREVTTKALRQWTERYLTGAVELR